MNTSPETDIDEGLALEMDGIDPTLSSHPMKTIRDALEITHGNYLLPDGRNSSEGLAFFAQDMDAEIGERIGEYTTRWDPANDVLELHFN